MTYKQIEAAREICSEETYKEILNCGYETTDIVLKD